MRFRKILTLLLTALLICGLLPVLPAAAANDMPAEVIDRFMAKSYTDPDSGLTLPYRMFIPDHTNKTRQYSLLLFLHGAGERGTDNRRQIAANTEILTRIVQDTERDHACIIIAPQCPNDAQWVDTPWGNGSYELDQVPQSKQLAAAMKLVDLVVEGYDIDQSRMYVSGISMGGYGAWDTVMRYPDTFAAAIPVCGAGDPSKAGLLQNVAIRTFHSSDDGTVPVSGSREMSAAVKAAGGNIDYKEYTGYGHGSWQPAFAEPDLVDWLFAQRKPAAITGVSQPDTLTVSSGTSFEQLGLPETLEVELDNGETVSAAVEWADNDGAGHPYDGDAAGEYTLVGQLSAENTVNPNGLLARITVKVEARPAVLPGDMDSSGDVTIQDVMEACKVLARQSAGKAPTADEMLRGNLDGDDKFTISDIMEICKILARKA
ncbi:MAG: prolyl oligopeptidase family serine peptidase [Clostridiales bacterium]|nr:prolyl oligopeptidase family serine peptidase [Clostridiales bacterium]